MEGLKMLLFTLANSKIFELVAVAIVLDTLFGGGRAIRQRCFNSCLGIDGAIRKIGMVLSLVGLSIIDEIVHINLIGFIPETWRTFFPTDLAIIGLADFFGIMYLCYETVSILKNMYLCGLPVKKLWQAVKKFLSKYTTELPEDDLETETCITEEEGATHEKS